MLKCHIKQSPIPKIIIIIKNVYDVWKVVDVMGVGKVFSLCVVMIWFVVITVSFSVYLS